MFLQEAWLFYWIPPSGIGTLPPPYLKDYYKEDSSNHGWQAENPRQAWSGSTLPSPLNFWHLIRIIRAYLSNPHWGYARQSSQSPHNSSNFHKKWLPNFVIRWHGWTSLILTKPLAIWTSVETKLPTSDHPD